MCVCVCTGSTYIACDWDAEVKEKCYDEEAIKVKLNPQQFADYRIHVAVNFLRVLIFVIS